MIGGVEPEVALSYPFTVGATALGVPLHHQALNIKILMHSSFFGGVDSHAVLKIRVWKTMNVPLHHHVLKETECL